MGRKKREDYSILSYLLPQNCGKRIRLAELL